MGASICQHNCIRSICKECKVRRLAASDPDLTELTVQNFRNDDRVRALGSALEAH